MSETNSKTIATYNAHIQDYVLNTPNSVDDLSKIWLDASVDGLPRDAKILEIGTGIGLDAIYVEEQGFKVERSDAASGFVQQLQQQGYQARILDVLADKIEGQYDLVFADAVIQHFTEGEAKVVIQNVFDALTAPGRFAFSLRIGEREGWSDEKLGAPRYFRYWRLSDMETLLRQVGFGDVKATDGHMEGSSWVHLIAYKS